jgi:hypothetical protein
MDIFWEREFQNSALPLVLPCYNRCSILDLYLCNAFVLIGQFGDVPPLERALVVASLQVHPGCIGSYAQV